MDTEWYMEAATRHLVDAEQLQAGNRFDNSAYLCGYVIECALKAVLRSEFKVSGRQFGHDLSSMSRMYLLLASSLSPAAARYPVPVSRAGPILGAWDPSMRYGRTGAISAEKSREWLEGARETHADLVVNLWLDGIRDKP